MADSYAIVSQEEVMDYSTPTPTPSIRVTFTTKPNQVAGTVIIPRSTYSPATVHQAVQAQADLLESVQAL